MSEKNIKIIGLAGSPRTQSNSTAVLNSVLAGATGKGAQCELIMLAELSISPCTHCDYCCNAGSCIFHDDMQRIYEQIKSADAIVISSPIYFMGLCSQLKLMVDRCQVFWAYRNTTGNSLINGGRRNRKGIFIATGARNTKSVFAGAKESIRWLFDSLDCQFWDSILIGNCESPGQINSMPEKLQLAYELGEKLTESYK